MDQDLSKQHSQFINDKDREDLEKTIVAALEKNDIELIKSLTTAIHIADLADLIDRLPDDTRKDLITIIKDTVTPELLVEIENNSIKENIIEYLGFKKAARLISELEIDDAVAILVDLNEETKNAIIKHIKEKKRKELEELFSYPENSIARIMQKKFVAVPEYWTVGQTIDYMRSSNNLPKEFYEIFVIDPKYKPIGYVKLGSLMHYQRDVIIKDIMRTKMKIIDTNLDQEEVSFLFKQYGLISVPVVNKIGRLVGAVTLDDALELIEKEAEEDIMHMGGVNETDFHLDIFEIVKSRFPWLFINLLTATIASLVIQIFEGTIQSVVALAAIMPIVASMGGNAGTQTMTVSVVALSTKELTTVNALRVIIKQVIACSLNGLVLAFIGGILIAAWHHNLYLSLVFGLSVIINFSLAGFFGASIPVIIHKLGLDPAIATPIFLTALTDMFGFLTFLGLATIFLF